MEKKLVYIYGYYGEGNLGDELLLEATKKIFGEKNCNFVAKMGPINQTVDRVHFFPPIPSKKTKFFVFHYYLERAKEFYNLSGNLDYLVFGGGSIFNKSVSITTLVYLKIIITIAQIKKIEIFGLGMGVSIPTTYFKRILASSTLRNFSKIVLRDQKSYEAAKQLTPKTHLVLGSDLFFTMPRQTVKKNKLENGPIKSIGITVCPQFLSLKFLGDPITKEAVQRSFVNIITTLLENNFKIKFLVFQHAKEDADDSIYFQKLIENLMDETLVPTYFLTLDNYLTIYDKIDLVLGMRYHSLAIAAACKKPFIGIGFDQKIHGICEQFSQPCFDIIAFQKDEIDKNILELLFQQNVYDKNLSLVFQKALAYDIYRQ